MTKSSVSLERFYQSALACRCVARGGGKMPIAVIQRARRSVLASIHAGAAKRAGAWVTSLRGPLARTMRIAVARRGFIPRGVWARTGARSTKRPGGWSATPRAQITWSSSTRAEGGRVRQFVATKSLGGSWQPRGSRRCSQAEESWCCGTPTDRRARKIARPGFSRRLQSTRHSGLSSNQYGGADAKRYKRAEAMLHRFRGLTVSLALQGIFTSKE